MSSSPNLDREERFVPGLLSTIPEELIIPLFTSFSGFPWKALSEILEKQLSIPDFMVDFKNASWRAPVLGHDKERYRYLEIHLSPLETPIYISFMPDDLKVMMGILLGKEHKPWNLTISEEEHAVIYLALEVAASFSKLTAFKSFNPRVVGFTKPIEERMYQVQFKLTFYDQETWLQCLIPSSFQREFAAHFQKMPLDLFAMKMGKKLPLALSLQIGSTSLHPKDWKGVREGDVILLDRCTYDPETQKGNRESLYSR